MSPGQGERRRPRTLAIVLFVTEKRNADDRERVVRAATAANDNIGKVMTGTIAIVARESDE